MAFGKHWPRPTADSLRLLPSLSQEPAPPAQRTLLCLSESSGLPASWRLSGLSFCTSLRVPCRTALKPAASFPPLSLPQSLPSATACLFPCLPLQFGHASLRTRVGRLSLRPPSSTRLSVSPSIHPFVSPFIRRLFAVLPTGLFLPARFHCLISLPCLPAPSYRPARLDQVARLRPCIPVPGCAASPCPILLRSLLLAKGAPVSFLLDCPFRHISPSCHFPLSFFAHHEVPLLLRAFACKKACAYPQISVDFRANLAFPLETG